MICTRSKHEKQLASINFFVHRFAMSLIDDLGGTAAVAAYVAEKSGRIVTRPRVWHWHTDAPAWARPYLAKMAAEKGVDLPDGFLPEFLQVMK